jgi:ribonuclease P protein component
VANNKILPLKRSSDFLNASKNGYRLKLTSWVTLHVDQSSDGNSYFGVTASRKVGSAVVRNKLKRWVRYCAHTEVWPKKLLANNVVFVFRAQSDKDFFSKVRYCEFLEKFRNI